MRKKMKKGRVASTRREAGRRVERKQQRGGGVKRILIPRERETCRPVTGTTAEKGSSDMHSGKRERDSKPPTKKGKEGGREKISGREKRPRGEM